MAGFNGITGDETIMFADNASFDGTDRGGKMTTDGQLWIGSTAASHVKLGSITSPDGSIVVGYSSPNITLEAAGSLPYISLTPYIVGSDIHSGYSTIQDGINAAVASGATATGFVMVYVKPHLDGSDYVENISLADNVFLVAVGGGTVINGKITANNTGSVNITGFALKNTSDYMLSITNTANITLRNCFFNGDSHDIISMSAAGDLTLLSCQGNIGTANAFFGITNTNTSTPSNGVNIDNCFITNGSSTPTPSVITAGQIAIRNSTLLFPIQTTATSAISIQNSFINTGLRNVNALTIGGSGSNYITGSNIASGSASAISFGTTATITQCTINSSNTNTLTGAGTMNYALIAFSGSSSGHNVTTETPLPTLL